MKFFVQAREKKCFMAKNFAHQFYYSSFLLSSVEVPFCYRMILERIGSPRKVINYEFRHKHSISPKTVILSPHKNYDQLFRLI